MEKCSSYFSRSVRINSGKIELITEGYEGLTYSYYLHHNNGIEKVSYSNSKSCIFNIPVEQGYYRGIFFYLNQRKERLSYSIEFMIKDSNIKLINKEIIAEDDNYKIDYYDCNSNITFVVFNAAGSNKKSTPFALKFLLNRGFNIIACNQSDNTFYQYLSFNKFREIVLPLVKDKTVYCYGSSLGAYCSVYYSGAINATVIASAPLNPAHPSIIKRNGWENKIPKELYRHVDMSNNDLTHKKVYVFIDPHVEQDVYFYENFIQNAYPSTELIECNHAGHQVLYYLNDTKQLRRIIDTIVEEGQVPKVFDNIDSKYTDIGKAKFYIKQQDGNKAVFFSKRALSYGELSEKLNTRFLAVLKKAESLCVVTPNLEESTVGLSRYVVINNYKIQFVTESSENLSYAFYLYHRNGIEKVFYTNASSCIFNISLYEGNYKGIFFYQNNKKERKSYNIEFIVTKDFKIKMKDTTFNSSKLMRK